TRSSRASKADRMGACQRLLDGATGGKRHDRYADPLEWKRRVGHRGTPGRHIVRRPFFFGVIFGRSAYNSRMNINPEDLQKTCSVCKKPLSLEEVRANREYGLIKNEHLICAVCLEVRGVQTIACVIFEALYGTASPSSA